MNVEWKTAQLRENVRGVCVRVCVCERERDKERGAEIVCVCERKGEFIMTLSRFYREETGHESLPMMTLYDLSEIIV